jgi:hypothetical protein
VAKVRVGIWPRLVCCALLIILFLGSVLGYTALAITINGEPPYSAFSGWVAVMQQFSQGNGDQVQLLVQAVTSGRQPLVRYTVGTCGSQRFTGVLLIDGGAELSHPRSVPAVLTEGLAPAEPSIPPAPIISGTQAYVQGYLNVPLQQNSNGPFGLWQGPNVSQAWPLTGSPLTWTSDDPIQPTARLTDSGSMNTLQDWIVIAGVGMGIGGSLLAGLIVETLRSRAAVTTARAAAAAHMHFPHPKGGG